MTVSVKLVCQKSFLDNLSEIALLPEGKEKRKKDFLLRSEFDSAVNDAVIATENAIRICRKYKDSCYVASPCKGEGANRSVILGNKNGRWIQLVKIWGNSKIETLDYSRELLKQAKE